MLFGEKYFIICSQRFNTLSFWFGLVLHEDDKYTVSHTTFSKPTMSHKNTYNNNNAGKINIQNVQITSERLLEIVGILKL